MRLRVEIALWLSVKGLALALIWYAFFSSSHRVPVNGAVTSERFGLTAAATGAAASEPSGSAEKVHD